ncbi:MAG TPA: DUF2793 domain-containing protein [Devosia sp.]|nr:DUF2793 domain-containing protein [Devosia sp.]
MANTPRLNLPLIESDQALKHVTHNEALATLDGLIQTSVEMQGALTPPGSPALGATYEIGTGASGDWLGRDGELAMWTDGGWRYVTPFEGWLMWDKALAALFVYRSGAWTGYSPQFAEFQNIALFGVNATADVTNKLSVSSDAALFGHDSSGTGDMRIKINKSATANTASHLFQVGFSGRAELGLTGDDDFHIKVSPDNFTTSFQALRIDKDNGDLIAENRLSVGHSGAPASILHVVGQPGSGATAVTIDGDGGSGDKPLRIRNAAGVDKCIIRGDGDVENVNNNYGSLSDVSLKQDIRKARSQWHDVARLRLCNYRLRSAVDDDPDGAPHLGLIAQETEKISQGLVFQNEDGLLGIKYSIVHLKALGALQEAMLRIEKLEQAVADLSKSASKPQ